MVWYGKTPLGVYHFTTVCSQKYWQGMIKMEKNSKMEKDGDFGDFGDFDENPIKLASMLIDAGDQWADAVEKQDKLKAEWQTTYSASVDRVRIDQRLGVAAAEHVVKGSDPDLKWMSEKLAEAKADAKRKKVRKMTIQLLLEKSGSIS